jgi:hypothetical protein
MRIWAVILIGSTVLGCVGCEPRVRSAYTLRYGLGSYEGEAPTHEELQSYLRGRVEEKVQAGTVSVQTRTWCERGIEGIEIIRDPPSDASWGVRSVIEADGELGWEVHPVTNERQKVLMAHPDDTKQFGEACDILQEILRDRWPKSGPRRK